MKKKNSERERERERERMSEKKKKKKKIKKISILNINVGVLGHVDSGKTSLVRSLSTMFSTASNDKSRASRGTFVLKFFTHSLKQMFVFNFFVRTHTQTYTHSNKCLLFHFLAQTHTQTLKHTHKQIHQKEE